MLRLITILMLSHLFIQGGASFAEESFQSEQVNVDGYWEVEEPRKPTPADHTRKQAEELKKKTNEWVDNKVEKERLQAEQGIASKIKNMFHGKNPKDEKGKVEAEAKASPPQVEATETTSISLLGGLSHLMISDNQGLSNNDYKSKGSFGFELSKRVSPRVDIGVGVRYSLFEFSKNPYSSFDRYRYGGPSGTYRDRAILGRSLSAHLVGRFYLTEGKVQPFISGLLGYNGLMLEFGKHFEENFSYDPYDSYGREKSYTDSYINTGIGTGVVVYFAKNWGGILEGNFTKNFAINTKDNSDFRQPYDDRRGYIDDRSILTNLGEEVKDGIQLNVAFGIIASF